MMLNAPKPDEGLSESQAQALSALVDAECGAEEAEEILALWGQSDDVRQRWYEAHCIGDALRSPDLASNPAHDAQFLQAFRARLAQEPVLLAPQALPAVAARSRGRASRWWMAASIAAGVGTVALGLSQFALLAPGSNDWAPRGPAQGVLASSKSAGSPAPGSVAASQPFDGKQFPPLVSQASWVAASAPRASIWPPANVTSPVQTPDVQLIRDARLDRYLAAHQGFSAASPLGDPSAHLRNVTVEPRR